MVLIGRDDRKFWEVKLKALLTMGDERTEKVQGATWFSGWAGGTAWGSLPFF